MAAVSVRDVSVAFGSIRVLDRLALEIAAGEFLVLLGPSGCGKSTLLNAIAGLLEIETGEIWIGERNVTWEEPKDRGIAMVFQSYALYPRMNVRANLSFGLKMAKTPRAEIERRVAQAATMLQIQHLLDRKPSQLSGGQRQRVAIGRALVRDAKVFLLDEPLSNLDAKLRAEMRLEIKKLHQRLGVTMIYVTHDQIEAMTLATQIAVMRDGEIQQLADPATCYESPRTLFVADFLGSPSMNFLRGHLVSQNGQLAAAVGDLRLPVDGYAFADRPDEGRPIVLGIRPEKIGLADQLPGHVQTELTCELLEPMGADTLAWFDLAGQPLSARLPARAGAQAGDRLWVGFDLASLSIFCPDTERRL